MGETTIVLPSFMLQLRRSRWVSPVIWKLLQSLFVTNIGDS